MRLTFSSYMARGGCLYNYLWWDCRTEGRNAGKHTYRYFGVGFRLSI
jgi:hypothetical protein